VADGVRPSRVPDALQRLRCCAEPGPSKPSIRCRMGPGSAAHRWRSAALRPGH